MELNCRPDGVYMATTRKEAGDTPLNRRDNEFMSIEALLERVAVGLERVADNQERLIAGQAAAIDKIEQPKAKRETAAEKKAREAAEKAAATGAEPEQAPATEEPKGNAEPASTASGATDAGSAANDGPTDEQLKATAVAWVGTTEDPEEKKRRAEWLQAMARSLLGETDTTKMLMLTGADSKLTPEHRKKAVFFIKRAHKLKSTEQVDFTAPYDFDEAPDQDAPRVEPEAAAAAEPEFDPLG